MRYLQRSNIISVTKGPATYTIPMDHNNGRGDKDIFLLHSQTSPLTKSKGSWGPAPGSTLLLLYNWQGIMIIYMGSHTIWSTELQEYQMLNLPI